MIKYAIKNKYGLSMFWDTKKEAQKALDYRLSIKSRGHIVEVSELTHPTCTKCKKLVIQVDSGICTSCTPPPTIDFDDSIPF